MDQRTPSAAAKPFANRVGRARSFVLGCALGGLAFVSGRLEMAAAEAHRVQPKATRENPTFATRCAVLRDGSFLAYYVRPGAGPTLVLVPETHGDRAQYFEPAFIDALDPRLGVVVIESRGQGRSWPPAPAEQASIEQYASDVLEVVGLVKPARWYVSGHSLGGMIAIEIAGRKPAGLCGVIPLEGWANASVQSTAFPETQPRTEAEKASAREQRAERYRSQRWTADEVTALGKMWTSWKRGEAILRETNYPVLSVWGDRGRQVRPRRKQLLLPDKPNVEVAWIKGSDHYVTDPVFAGDVVGLINAFIARVEKIGAPPQVIS